MGEHKWAYPIEITLTRGEGVCVAGHEVGDHDYSAMGQRTRGWAALCVGPETVGEI